MMAEEIGPEGHVTGLDFSENMLKVGREKVKEADLHNVELIHGTQWNYLFRIIVLIM